MFSVKVQLCVLSLFLLTVGIFWLPVGLFWEGTLDSEWIFHQQHNFRDIVGKERAALRVFCIRKPNLGSLNHPWKLHFLFASFSMWFSAFQFACGATEFAHRTGVLISEKLVWVLTCGWTKCFSVLMVIVVQLYLNYCS